jgi:predicted acylesterase/phospholipase RssA
MGQRFSRRRPSPVDFSHLLRPVAWTQGPFPTHHFENLVFPGGASNNTASIGVYKVLYDLGILTRMTRFAGTSSGSMLAACAAARISATELIGHFLRVDTAAFKDDSFGYLRDTYRLFRNMGWCKGDVLEAWMEQILFEHTGVAHITFQQLYDMHGTHLHINGTNLTQGCGEMYHHATTPHMVVSRAVRISTSYPGAFAAVRHPGTGDILTDGGVDHNLLLDLWDAPDGTPNPRTLGVRIVPHAEPPQHPDNIVEFLVDLIEYQNSLIQELRRPPAFMARTIPVASARRSIREFHIAPAQRVREIEHGIARALHFLHAFADRHRFSAVATQKKTTTTTRPHATAEPPARTGPDARPLPGDVASDAPVPGRVRLRLSRPRPDSPRGAPSESESDGLP